MIRKAPVNGCLLYNSPNIAVHSGCCGHVELLLLNTVLQFALWAPLLGSLSSSIFFSPLVFFMLHEFCLSTYNQCLSNNFLLMDSNPCCTFFHFLYICFIWNDIYFVWPSQWQCRDSKVCTSQQVKLIPLFALTIMGSKSNVQDSVWQRRIVCGQREGQCPSLSMSTHFIIGKEKCRSVSFAVINASTFLINLPPPCCLFPFMLPK